MPFPALQPVSSTPDGPAPAVAELCPVCGAARPGEYCPDCGERRARPDDLALATLTRGLVDFLTHVDGKLLRTLLALLRAPGFLTAEYLAGRRGPYAKPLQLFVAINVAIFLLAPWIGLFSGWGYDGSTGPQHPVWTQWAQERMAELGLEEPAFRARFDAMMDRQKRSMMLAMVPLFALAARVLMPRRLYGEHLVFATHFFAFQLLFIPTVLAGGLWCLQLGLHALGATVPLLENRVLTGIIAVTTTLYLQRSLVRAYGLPPARSLVHAVLLAGAFVGLVSLFRRALVLTTLWAM
jgi:hypothetical protein